MNFFSGFKSRGRKCYGLRCSGCDREWAECENSACSDYMDVTDWTPWINTTVVEVGFHAIYVVKFSRIFYLVKHIFLVKKTI